VSASDKHFEAFADHTLLKHAILSAYLQRWAFKILQWGRAVSSVYFVDGFAGSGRDRQGNPGSPVIACRIAQQVRAHFAKKNTQGRLGVFAVEADPAKYDLLLDVIAPFEAVDPGCIHALSGSAAAWMDDITRVTGMQPTLFFLDPFGLKGLDAATYPSMLAGPQNEVLALFHDVGAARLRGVVHAGARLEQELSALAETPTFFPEMDEQMAESLRAKEARRLSIVRKMTPAAKEAVSRALGDATWEIDLRDLPPDRARSELIFRFVKKLAEAGARHFHVLPMRGETGGHKYCLVHATKSPAGYIAMKEAVSESLNRSELSEIMRERMRVDLGVPLSEVDTFLQDRFGGTTLRWTSQKGQGSSVRSLLLVETSVFPFQCQEIREHLRSNGWLRRVGRRDECEIPAG
jgi:three-Cys-motif partner protein